MINLIKEIKYSIKWKFFPYQLSNAEYIEYLKRKNIHVGKGTVFFGPNIWTVDTQRPWLIEIGEYCKITRGVQILSHDYSRSVLRRVYGEVLGEAKKTSIGNNVFIGVNSVVLMGAEIGDNVIIGANSVVTGTIPSNSVVAGNPARVIRTLDEHYRIRKDKYLEEARLCVKEYYNRNNHRPSIGEMGAFFPIYAERDLDYLAKNRIKTDLNGDDEADILKYFLNSRAIYNGYDSFVRSCLGEGE